MISQQNNQTKKTQETPLANSVALVGAFSPPTESDDGTSKTKPNIPT